MQNEKMGTTELKSPRCCSNCLDKKREPCFVSTSMRGQQVDDPGKHTDAHTHVHPSSVCSTVPNYYNSLSLTVSFSLPTDALQSSKSLVRGRSLFYFHFSYNTLLPYNLLLSTTNL